jgi:hypothetical protein
MVVVGWVARKLLNVGPDGNGEVQAQAFDLLKETRKLIDVEPISKNIPKVSKVPGIRGKATVETAP